MSTRLNCVFLGPFLYPNGYAATKRKQQFLDYIRDEGDSVQVLITLKWAKGHEANNNKGVHQGIPYEVLGSKVKRNIWFPITFTLFTLKAMYRLAQIKKKGTKNILVAFGINFDTLIPLLFARISGYRIVFDIVEDFSTLIFSNNIKGKTKKWFLVNLPETFERMLISGATVITNYLYQKYATYKKIPLKLVPVSAQNLLEKREITGDYFAGKPDRFRLLYSGTYGEKEGLPTLITSFSRLHAKYPDTQLILTGHCPDELKKKFTESLNDAEAILFTGKLKESDYYRVLSSVEVLLMTRTNSAYANAGFPFKLGEYLATGNPVISTRVSDIDVYLVDKESALIISPDDPHDLFNAMVWIKNHEFMAKEIGMKGQEVCVRHFNPRINSGLFYQVLLDC